MLCVALANGFEHMKSQKVASAQRMDNGWDYFCTSGSGSWTDQKIYSAAKVFMYSILITYNTETSPMHCLQFVK